MREDAVSRRRGCEAVLWYIAVGGLLHYLWENLQMPLYVDPQTFLQHALGSCLRAAVGDMGLMLVLYLLLAAIHGSIHWAAWRPAYRHPATWIVTVAVGLLLGVSVELWAVYVSHRWAYAAAMPLLPIIRVGLTPMLQMVAVPLLTLWLTSRSWVVR